VPLRAGLGAVSVPSKTYSILASARPVVAAIDAGTEVTRILASSGAGISVANNGFGWPKLGRNSCFSSRGGQVVLGPNHLTWLVNR
jgi:hypothetical protein